MRTVEQIRAALAQATTDEERSALITELEGAIAARAEGAEPSELDQLRSRLTEVEQRRSTLTTEFEQVTTGAVDDDGNARDFTVPEAEQRGALRAQLDQLQAEHTQLEDQVRQRVHDERDQRMSDQITQVRRDLGLGDAPANSVGGGVTDIREHRVYEKANRGVSFLKDQCIVGFGPGATQAEYFRAMERLQAHGRENHYEALELDKKSSRSDAEDYFLRQMVEVRNQREQEQGPLEKRGLSYRALSTAATAGGEFVPPLYKTAEWVEFLRAGRVVANCMHHEDLPDGTMVMNIPKVVSGSSFAAQGTQNTNVSMTDLVTAYITVPVFTAAGGQIVSLQILERSPIHFEDVIWRDLAKAQAQTMNQYVISGTGENGQPTGILNTAGINTVTWTQASPTIKGLYGQIGLGKLDVANSIFASATHQFMTPNLWEWIGQSFDSQGRPLVVPSYAGPFNAIQVAPDTAQAEGVIGSRMSGLSTFEDANLPQNLGSGTNQDIDLICRAEENYLYEGPLVTRALPQTYGAQLSVLLQAYQYGAFSAARYPTANSVITGTGMAQSNRVFNS